MGRPTAKKSSRQTFKRKKDKEQETPPQVQRWAAAKMFVTLVSRLFVHKTLVPFFEGVGEGGEQPRNAKKKRVFFFLVRRVGLTAVRAWAFFAY